MAITVNALGSNGLELTIHGTLQKKDYELFRPHVEGRLETHDKTNLLVHVADLSGFTPAALWEDLKFDVSHYNDVGRLAIVGEDTSSQWMATLARPFTSAEIKYFSLPELDAARDWIREGE